MNVVQPQPMLLRGEPRLGTADVGKQPGDGRHAASCLGQETGSHQGHCQPGCNMLDAELADEHEMA